MFVGLHAAEMAVNTHTRSPVQDAHFLLSYEQKFDLLYYLIIVFLKTGLGCYCCVITMYQRGCVIFIVHNQRALQSSLLARGNAGNL